MAVNLFFTDLDGTLLVNHQLDEEIVQGIRDIQERGGHVVYDTGRPPVSVWNLKGPIDWLICCNGALIYDGEGELVSTKQIPAEDLRDFLFTFGDQPVQFLTPDGVWCNQSAKKAARGFLKMNGLPDLPHFLIPDPLIPRFIRYWETNASAGEMMRLPAVKIEMYNRDPEKLKRWMKKHPHLVNAPSTRGLAEITLKEATKGHAAREVMERLGKTDAEVAVFGDGINDLPLLEEFENSWCPDTGTEEAKRASRNVLEMTDPHAVIRKMKELFHG